MVGKIRNAYTKKQWSKLMNYAKRYLLKLMIKIIQDGEEMQKKIDGYQKLWDDREKLHLRSIEADDHDGDNIYIAHDYEGGWGYNEDGSIRMYHIFKIGYTRHHWAVRMYQLSMNKIYSIKVASPETFEKILLNRCYEKNIERCRGIRQKGVRRGFAAHPFEKIHGKEWFATLTEKKNDTSPQEMEKDIIEIVIYPSDKK